ncbi:lipid IV(A) 3-deoxy-D-manno-octulosonic acid transferase [Aliikangiella sp. IMCC44653]
MNRFVYSCLLYLVSPVILGYFAWRAVKAPEYRHGFWQRLGFAPKLSSLKSASPTSKPVLLIHCASVGETRAAIPLISALQSRFSDYQIVVTTTTPTGKQEVAKAFGGSVTHSYFPIDWIGSCQRFIRRVSPKLVIIMETELWPNWLNQCRKQNVPVLLANARLSNKSFAKYAKYKKLTSQIFECISLVAAQFESDKNNYLGLGVAPHKVQLCGNIKFDLTLSDEVLMQQQQLHKDFFATRPVWVAASIHPGEFAQVLAAHRELLLEQPNLILIAIPRHPEKFDELANFCEQKEMCFLRRSQMQSLSREQVVSQLNNSQVLVGDTMGEVLLFCGVAQSVFVGGSLIDRGGHNPLEAIVCGNAVLMGPSIYNFSDIADKLLAAELLQVVSDSSDLANQVKLALQKQASNTLTQRRALQFMQANQGCIDKTVAACQSQLNKP